MLMMAVVGSGGGVCAPDLRPLCRSRPRALASCSFSVYTLVLNNYYLNANEKSDFSKPFLIEAKRHTSRTQMNKISSREAVFTRGARGSGGARRPEFNFGAVWEHTPGNRHIHIYSNVSCSHGVLLFLQELLALPLFYGPERSLPTRSFRLLLPCPLVWASALPRYLGRLIDRTLVSRPARFGC